MKKKVLIIGAVIIALLSISTKKAKASDEISNFSSVIEVTESNDANVHMSFVIENTNSTQLITGQNIKVPFSSISNLKVYINQIQVSSTIVAIEDYNEIIIDFSANPVKFSEVKEVSLDFNASNVLDQLDEIKIFKFYGGFNEANAFMHLEIIHPESFGDVTYHTLENLSRTELGDGRIKESFETNGPLLITWGNHYSKVMSSTEDILSNVDSKNNLFSFNLIPDTFSQTVIYKNILNAEYGLYDSLGNYYAVSDLSKVSQIGFTAEIVKSSVELSSIETEAYNFKIPQDTQLKNDVYALMDNYSDPYDKLKALNTYFVGNTTSLSENKNYYDDLEKIWQKSTKKDSFSSFDYCYLLTSVAEDLGIKSEINFGYIMLPKTINSPHFWCKFKYNGKTFLIDTYLQKLLDLNYFGLNSDFDRVQLGIWHPKYDYNNALGMFITPNYLQILNDSQENIETVSDNSVSLIVRQQGKIYSAINTTLLAEFNNKSSKVLPIKDWLVDGKSISDKLRVNEFLFPALLPNQTNSYKIEFIKFGKLWEENDKNVQFSIIFGNDTPNLEQSFTFTLYRDPKIIVMAVIIINFLVVVICLVLWRLIHKYRNRYY